MITERMQELAGISEAKLTLSQKQDTGDLQGFIRSFNSMTTQHPLTPSQRIINGVVSAEVEIFDGRIHMSSLINFGTDQKQGVGTKAMQDIIKLADRHGVELELTPSPIGNTTITKSKLKSFYGRFGFKQVRPDIMRRKPNT